MINILPTVVLSAVGQQTVHTLIFPCANKLLQHVTRASFVRQISYVAAQSHGDTTLQNKDTMPVSLLVSAVHGPAASGDLNKLAPNFATTGVKKTFYKRKLPCPPATEFSSPQGECRHDLLQEADWPWQQLLQVPNP